MKTFSIICRALVGPFIICHGVSPPEVWGDNSTFRQVRFEKKDIQPVYIMKALPEREKNESSFKLNYSPRLEIVSQSTLFKLIVYALYKTVKLIVAENALMSRLLTRL